ncbi:MAG: hypothetical protein AAF197_04015 [Pseudomonadota bacterium]
MSKSKSNFGFWGIGFGGTALLLALVHFWAGPFSPTPTLETAIADKVVSIRDATVKALKGEEYREVAKPKWDTDKITYVLTALLGGIALILSVLSFAKQENSRMAIGGAALGICAIAFQFIAMFAMALLFVILLAAVISSLGFG